MHVTDIAINQALGIQLAMPDEAHILSMPETPLLLNHVGTIHAGVLFSLAEAASAEFLLQKVDQSQNQVFAVVRRSEIKFSKPAQGNLQAFVRFANDSDVEFTQTLKTRGRVVVSLFTEIKTTEGTVVVTATFDWFLRRQT